ncbi:MAG: hypothetical protein MUC50_02395 [Myxococcota bacterium]|nr:hypothetical protein [Myxococcota bacterium]
MYFKVALYVSLSFFAAGLLFRLVQLFTQRVGISAQEPKVSAVSRIGLSLKAIVTAFFSPRLFKLLGSVFLDGLLQLRVLRDRRDITVWLMHILIFVGFVGLLLFHALGAFVSTAIDPDYQSTLNPFLFLRNLFGLLAVAGLFLAILRRAVLKRRTIKTTAADVFVLVLLLTIMLTGFLLEGLKIHSYAAFARMANDYGSGAQAEETRALEAYWVEHYGLAATHVKPPFDEKLIASGAEQHAASCATCHSKPKYAFVSYGIASITRPFSAQADRAGAYDIVWYIHVTACFLGLALIGFTKMFHMFATAFSAAVASATQRKQPSVNVANAATRAVIELRGCSHGGTCHEDCPVRVQRQERIETQPRYGAVWDEIGRKPGKELGNREAIG